MKKITHILSFLLFISFSGNAQDTLLIESVTVPYSVKVNDLIKNTKESNDVALKLRYLLEAENYAQRLNDTPLLFDIYTQIGNIYKNEKLGEQALKYFNKAYQLPTPPITKELRVPLFDWMATSHVQVNQPDSASFFLNKKLKYFQKRQNYKGQLETLQQQVNVFLENKNYERALTANLSIEFLLEKNEDKKNLAVLYNNIGYNYNYLKRHEYAIQYFEKALDLRKEVPELNTVILFTNIGIAFNNINDSKNALRNLRNAEKELLRKQQKDKNLTSNAHLENLIATIYLNNNDVYNALKYNDLAIASAKKQKDFKILDDAYKTAADIHQALFDYELALEYYEKHLDLRDSFRLEDRVRQQQLLQQQFLLEKSEKEIKLLLSSQELQEKELQDKQNRIKLLESETEANNTKLANQELEAQSARNAIALLESEQNARDAILKAKEFETQTAQTKLILAQKQLEAEQKDRELADAELQAKLEAANAEATEQEAANKIEILEKDKALNVLEIERQNEFQQFAYGLGGLLALLLIMMLSAFIYYRKASLRLAAKNKEIERERQRSEKLLLNILPQETAQELKTTGSATPKLYEKVTVLFTDFSEFTKISENMSPQELIEELNSCFKKFDEIIGEHGLEKIKTMGDGYLCAGGIPVSNESNPTDAIQAAIKMQAFMQQRYYEKQQQGIPYWNMRVGIHTGSVIAGVVGTQKFAYDIWGDTVNTASRMESGCENGKINISDTTYRFVKNKFDCTFRGEIEVKHKNKVGMYFING